MSTGRVTRATAVILASLTAVFGVAFANPAAAQPTSPTDDPAGAAVAWLAGEFVDGNHLETIFDGVPYPDHGLTADAVLAFDSADVAQTRAAAATAWLAEPDNVVTYAGNGTTDSYAGSLAKLSLVASAQGEDPTAFGGVDLVERLLARQVASGRFSDLSSFPPPSDFSNALSQSLAVISLLRVGTAEASAAAEAGAGYLAGSQCDDGGFPLQFEQATCTSQPDATGFAVQAMLAAGLDEEAGAALDYLEEVQDTGGGFSDGGVLNANSTGLAGQALRSGERTDAADAAVDFLLTLQIGCDGPAAERGSIRFDAAGAGDSQRATAQGIVGITGVSLLDVDATGDAAATPVIDCTPPSSSTSPSVPSTSAQAGPVPGGSGELPATGVRPVPATGVGVLLLLAGVGLVLLARQRRGLAGTGRS